MYVYIFALCPNQFCDPLYADSVNLGDGYVNSLEWNGMMEWTTGVPRPQIGRSANISIFLKVVHTITWSYQLAHMPMTEDTRLAKLRESLLWQSTLASLVAHNSS